MKLTHEEFLKKLLKEKKMQLNNLDISQQVKVAEFNTKRDLLTSIIAILEDQLEN